MTKSYLINEEVYTILDTGTSHLFLPPSLFEAFILNIIKEAGDPKFYVTNGEVYL